MSWGQFFQNFAWESDTQFPELNDSYMTKAEFDILASIVRRLEPQAIQQSSVVLELFFGADLKFKARNLIMILNSELVTIDIEFVVNLSLISPLWRNVDDNSLSI